MKTKEKRNHTAYLKGYRPTFTGYILSCIGFFLLTLILFTVFFYDARKNLRQQFQTDALRRIQVVRSLLYSSLDNLETLRLFFSASQVVSYEEFSLFTKRWIEEGLFQITGWIPSGEDDFPVFCSCPGDMRGVTLNREQKTDLSRARDSRGYTLSGPILSPVSMEKDESVILVFLPVYSGGGTGIQVVSGGAYEGTLFAQFSIGQLLSLQLSSVPALNLPLSILSGPGLNDPVLYVYEDTNRDYSKTIPLYFEKTPLVYSSGFTFADRNWTLVIEATRGYIMEHSSLLPWIILGGGIVLSLLLTVYLYQRSVNKKAFLAKVEELDRFFSLALDLLCITDENGHFIRLNPEWEQALGYSDEGMLGRSFFDFIHPGDIPATREAFERLSRGGKVTDFCNRYRRRDGTYRWIEWRSVAKDDFIYAAARDITERRDWERRLLDSINEKDILLKEIHHRVKNNLQIIASMLHMEMEKVTDAGMLNLLHRNQNRINTIAMIHEILYASDNITRIDFASHLKDLLSLYPYTKEGKPIHYSVDVSKLVLPLDIALPCGLIVNEILINSLQHAFDDNDDPRVEISLVMNEESGSYIFSMSDNGPGFTGVLDAGSSPGLGLKLISALSDQLNGVLSLEGDRGACIRILFPA